MPSRMLKYDKNKQGNKKPILGIYRSSEYRKPSKGFDLPAPGRAVLVSRDRRLLETRDLERRARAIPNHCASSKHVCAAVI